MGFNTVSPAYAGHSALQDWLPGRKVLQSLVVPVAWLSAQTLAQSIDRRGAYSGQKHKGRDVCRASRIVSWHHSLGCGTHPVRVAGRRVHWHGTRRGSVCEVRLGCSSTVSPGGFAHPECAELLREVVRGLRKVRTVIAYHLCVLFASGVCTGTNGAIRTGASYQLFEP